MRDHVTDHIDPLLNNLAREYRAATYPWYRWVDNRGTLIPGVGEQLSPILTRIAADIDAGRPV